MSMIDSKEALLARRVGSAVTTLDLPDGSQVRVVPVGSRLMRDYRAALRDEDGKPIEERKAYVDELLVARVLVDANGQRLISDEDVLAKVLDDMHPLVWDALMEYCWGFLASGDRQKKSSTIDSGEPS
jgi:hypothetical protein